MINTIPGYWVPSYLVTMLQIVATQAGENLRRGVYSSKEWDSGSSEKECGKSVEGCEVSISEQWQDKAMTVA